MEFDCLIPHFTEANHVMEDINKLFKDKDLDTVMHAGSNFKRDVLAESIFALVISPKLTKILVMLQTFLPLIM